jgi:hypothetical protein
MNRAFAALTTAAVLAIVFRWAPPSVEVAEAPAVKTPRSDPTPSAEPAPPVASRCDGLELTITPAPNQRTFDFVATIRKRGDEAVTLVAPGDGSEAGWRTPVVTWNVTTPSGAPVTPPPYLRCGNVNRLTKEEVFTLEPGAERQFPGWLGVPRAAARGHYSVSLVYENDPNHPMRGVSFGKDPEEVAAAVRGSTPCRVESQHVEVDLWGP